MFQPPTEVDRAAYIVATMAGEVRNAIAAIAMCDPYATWEDYRGHLRVVMGYNQEKELREAKRLAYAEYGIDPFDIGSLKTALETGRGLRLYVDRHSNALRDGTLLDKTRMHAAINLVFPHQFVRTRHACAALHRVYDAFLQNQSAICNKNDRCRLKSPLRHVTPT